MEIGLKHNGKKFFLNAKKLSFFGKFWGLMFSRREKAEILLFSFRKPKRWAIHSFFVFFPFVGIWIDGDGKIVEIRKIPSWKLHIVPEKKFVKLIEIPCNKKYFKILQFLDES